MKKLGKLFFSLAGLALLLGILVIIDDVTSIRIIPNSLIYDEVLNIKPYAWLFSPLTLYFIILFLLFVFSVIGYHFSQRSQTQTFRNEIHQPLIFSRDWPFYIMVAGLLLPFLVFIFFRLQPLGGGVEAGLGILFFLFLSFVSGGILIVLGVALYFIKRRKSLK